MTEEKRWLTPPMATLIVGGVTLGLSGIIALTYTPLRNDVDDLKRELNEIKADPSPKPETRVRMEAMTLQIEELMRRADRIDDRLGNLHVYLMQLTPPNGKPPITTQRRGDVFPEFKPQSPM